MITFINILVGCFLCPVSNWKFRDRAAARPHPLHFSTSTHQQNDDESIIPWIRTADVAPKSSVSNNSKVNVTVSLSDPSSDPKRSSSRLWLEYCQREIYNGEEGAYTVLRCDVDDIQRGISKIWGWSFHTERLKQSIKAIVVDGNEGLNLEEAIQTSEKMLYSFLQDYVQHKTSLDGFTSSIQTNGNAIIRKDTITSLMVAFLWTPKTMLGNGMENHTEIEVKGHACEVELKHSLDAINASLALINETSISDFHKLPSRHSKTPKAKLSGWCHRRRPLEDRFKKDFIGEVLLCFPQKDNPDIDWDILEGLTSNVFVLMKDGTLRTSVDNVLDGYAQSIILNAANKHGTHVELKAPTLSELKEGQWREVFITSSIRLAVPVNSIYALNSENEFVKLWELEVSESSLPFVSPLIDKILNSKQEIVHL